MKPMLITNFSEKDIESVTKFCEENMELDGMIPQVLREKTLGDERFDPEITLVAKEGNQIVGFMQGVNGPYRDGKCGWIKLMAVHRHYRRGGIASKLYGILEVKFRREGCNRIRIYDVVPNYFMPGIDPFYTEAVCFAERKGFKKWNDTSNLLADLRNQTFDTAKGEERLARGDYEIKRAEETDREDIMSFIAQRFAAWVPEVSNMFNNDPISLHIAKFLGRTVAFSGYDGNNVGLGWFGPMGTDESLRGKGVGGILYRRCLADQKKQGYSAAIIPWVGPIPFYMHYSNARVARVFWRYEKML
jgi:predicted N-acetyltransferase YhbS